jgi:DNA-binding response OmpR family regulator
MTSDVLVFGDEPAARGPLCDAVRNAGLRPRVIADEPSVIRVLSRGGPRVLIVDLALTGPVGKKVIDRIRSTPALRYVAIVAMGRDADLAGLGYEVDWKLPKPPDLSKVPAMMKSLVAVADGRRR